MFTGIVQDVGTIGRISRMKGHALMRIKTSLGKGDVRRGESINVNGACLTVERVDEQSFEAHISRETMSRTTFGHLKAGDRVNLERAMEAGDRFGGHFVQGHIDATGIVRKIKRSGEDVILRIECPCSLEQLFVEKGSVSIDGVSLTISALGRGWLEVTLVPYTMANTNLSSLRTGRRVNVEADVLGKYVKKVQETKARWNSRT